MFHRGKGKPKHRPPFPHNPPTGRRQSHLPSLPFLPPADAFYPTTVDVYTGSNPVPPTGNPRIASLNVLLTGTPIEGTRSRSSNTFGYTHIMLCDPTIVLQDSYVTDATAETYTATTADCITIPAGQKIVCWVVVISFVSVIPGLGRKRVAVLDRHGTPSTWSAVA
jgi:hypothetical protein